MLKPYFKIDVWNLSRTPEKFFVSRILLNSIYVEKLDFLFPKTRSAYLKTPLSGVWGVHEQIGTNTFHFVRNWQIVILCAIKEILCQSPQLQDIYIKFKFCLYKPSLCAMVLSQNVAEIIHFFASDYTLLSVFNFYLGR